MFSAIARSAAPRQHRNWLWLRSRPPMTIRRGQSCGASNPGNQEPRNPFEKLPLQVQRQYSRDLLHHVQRAVFSHLGVDPVDARHLPQYQPKNQVELHVHHHHHLYVDTPQNSQQPSSPQIAANNDTSVARSPRSKSMWRDYDEMANKTLLDILWSKNHPFYSSNINKKDTEPPKKHREETTSHPTFETACLPATTTGFSNTERTGENRGISRKVSPTTMTKKGLNSPVKSTWKEFSTPNKPVSTKRSSSAHVGTERKHSSRTQPTTKSITKSKIRSLEEAAQERIKRLSDLGSLINSAETGFREDSRPKDSDVPRHERREAAIQTHIDSNIMYGHQSRPKNETFQEESAAAQESFLAAAKAAKDRLRNLVNECANANARPYGVEDPQLLAADIRRQKELQALERIQSCIHDQEIGAQQNRTAKSPTWPPAVPATSPYIFSARPPSRESNNSEVPSSRPTARSSSPSSDISSRSPSRGSIALSDIPPSVQNARPPSQVSNAFDVPYAVNLTPAQNTWLPPSQASMPNYENQVKPYAPPDEVVERLQDASFQENNQAMEEILRKRPRPTRFGRKPRQPPSEDTKQVDAETPRESSVEDKVLPNQEQQQQQIEKLGSDLEVVRISSPLEYMRLFQEQQRRPKIKVVDGSGAKEKAQDTWAKVESELAKLVSGLALNNIEDALLNLERKLTNVESLRYQVVEAFKVRDEGHNNIMESDADQRKTDVPEGYSLYTSRSYETRAADLDTEDVISSPCQAEAIADKGNETENQTDIELECLKDENKKLRMELQQLQARNNSEMEMSFATQGKSHREIEALREMNKRLKVELQQIREDTENENNGCRAKFAIQEAEFEKLQEVNYRLQSELELRVQGKQMNDLEKQDLLQKLSAVVRESESLKCSLEVTKRELLDEDRKNGLLKQWLGDEDLHKREHVILNSAQELNSELINNLSRMEDTLTDFGTSTKSLLPFLEEHVAITKSLAEVFEKKRPEFQETTTSEASEITEKIEALKKAAEAKRHQINELVNINEELLQFAQRKEDELARLNEEAAQLQDDTGQQEMPEESNPQFLLMREIEETKKQSKEMVEIMDSLEYHYSILKAKFTQLENEMAQRDQTVERLSSHLAARIEGEEYVLEEAKQLQNSLKNAQYNEYEMKNQAERLAKMKQELEGKLHGLEREISMSHAQIEELKSQNTVIKDLMESKEKEAEAMRQETGDIKWRVMQLEEELMEKEGQIAILKGNFLDDSD